MCLIVLCVRAFPSPVLSNEVVLIFATSHTVIEAAPSAESVNGVSEKKGHALDTSLKDANDADELYLDCHGVGVSGSVEGKKNLNF